MNKICKALEIHKNTLILTQMQKSKTREPLFFIPQNS